MINAEQLALLADILGLEANTDLLNEVNAKADSAAAQAMLALHLRIKRSYVVHRPSAFRVEVSHTDFHRFPGALTLQIGDEIRLVSFTTEKYIPVQVIALPTTASGYYRGVITRQLAPGSQFETGESVYFSEDQVMSPNPQPEPRSRTPRRR